MRPSNGQKPVGSHISKHFVSARVDYSEQSSIITLLFSIVINWLYWVGSITCYYKIIVSLINFIRTFVNRSK